MSDAGPAVLPEDSPEAASAPDSSPRGGWRRRPSRATIPIVIAGLVGVVLVLYAWRLWPFTSSVQSTDDAYVRGMVTSISPQLSGYITEVAVRDFQTVQPGQALVRIDDRIFRQKVQQAQANLEAAQASLANSRQSQNAARANIQAAEAQVANARAQLDRAERDMRRAADLARDGSLSVRERDAAQATLEQARAALQQAQAQRNVSGQNLTTTVVGRGSLSANVAAAEAAVRLAQIDLDNTLVRAPIAGRLGEVGVRAGQYVTPGSLLMSLVGPQAWVIANMKETQMKRVRVGQPAVFRVDALGGARLRGRVSRIAPATGSEFAVLRPDNASGNFVKIAQRIPVEVSVEPGQPLAARLSPGMSVVVNIDTRG